jgi:hypothetical protein
MTRSMLVAAALLAAAPAALHAQRIASAATLPPASAASAAPTIRVALADTSRPSRGEPRRPEGVGPRSGTLTLDRESFSYAPDGRRDPFASLMAHGELRPMISDLRLTTVVFMQEGGSVAVLRDLVTKEQYRVRVGQQLGRMRVSGIGPKQITFTIEEFGFSRQESLALGDSTTSRTQQ